MNDTQNDMESDAKPVTRPSKQRLAYLDGVRAIACLLVLGYHFRNALNDVEAPSMLTRGLGFLHVGDLGVIVFFVLSGLVIALTIPMFQRAQQLGAYISKRMIRLDPTYWTVIAATIVIRLLIDRLGVGEAYTFPPVGHIVLNMFYLDNIFERMLDVESIVAVGWTLAYELQFYVFFAVLIFLIAIMNRSTDSLIKTLVIVLTITGFLSLGLSFDYPAALNPYALGAWRFFACGALIGCRLRQKKTVPLSLVMTLSFAQFLNMTPESVAGGLTLLVLIFVIEKPTYQKVLGGRILTWFGRISYSLYLTHALIGNRLIRFSVSKLIDPSDSLQCLIVLLCAIFVSVLSALMLFKIVEVPTQRFAARLNPYLK